MKNCLCVWLLIISGFVAACGDDDPRPADSGTMDAQGEDARVEAEAGTPPESGVCIEMDGPCETSDTWNT